MQTPYHPIRYVLALLCCLYFTAASAQTPIYQESFEDANHGWAITGYANVWLRRSGSTPSYQTGPIGGYTGAYYYYTEASSPRQNQTAYLESPAVSLPAGQNISLSFAYHMYGTSVGTLRLSVKQGAVTAEEWSLSGNQDNQWNVATVDLSAYAGSTVSLRFTGAIGNGWSSDMAVDDVQLLATDGGSPPPCDQVVTAFPYREGFESATSDWTEESPDGTTDLWRRRNGGTGSGGTGPSSAREGSYYYYTEASSPNYPAKESFLVGPCFDFSGKGNATLFFHYHMYGSAMGELTLEAQPQSGGEWQKLWSRAGNLGNAWTRASVSLNELLGGTYRLRFRGVTGTSFTGDAAIDNLEIVTQDAPTQGNWGPTIASFPYVEDFESGVGDWSQFSGSLNIYRRHSGGTTSSSTGPSAAYSGSYYMYTETSYPNYPNKKAYFVGPSFDLTGETRADFSFNYHAYGSNIGRLRLQASTDGGRSWETVWRQAGEDANGPLSGNWHAARVDLSPYVGGLVKLRFVTVTGASYRGDIAFDNLRLDIPDDAALVSGSIRFFPVSSKYEDGFAAAGQPVPNVSVSVKPTGQPNGTQWTATSNHLGTFAVATASGEVDVTPSYPGGDPRAGLGDDDRLAIYNHILGVELIQEPIGRLAGDVNRDGILTVSDMVELQNVALGNEANFANAPAWQFVSDYYLRRQAGRFVPDPVFQADFWTTAEADAAGNQYPYAATLVLPERTLRYAEADNDWVGGLYGWQLDAGAAELCRPTADFVMFKTGDVNRSANPNGTAAPSVAKALVNSTKSDKRLRLTQKKYKYEVSVFATAAEPIFGFQNALRYDTELLRVNRIIPNRNNLYGAANQHFGQLGKLDDPIIRTMWTADDNQGRQFRRDRSSRNDDLSQGLLLYRLAVDAYASAEQVRNAITLAPDDLPTVFHDRQGQQLAGVDVEIYVTANNGKSAGPPPSEKSVEVTAEGIHVFPNPVRQTLRYTLWGASQAATHVRLVSPTGNVARSVALAGDTPSTRTLAVDDLPAGVYYLEATGSGEILGTARVVLTR